MTEELGGDDVLRSQALNNMGVARVSTGDFAGMQELEESVAIAVATNSPESRAWLREPRVCAHGSRRAGRAREMVEKALSPRRAFASGSPAAGSRPSCSGLDYQAGRWDKAAEALDGWWPSSRQSEFWMESPCRRVRGEFTSLAGDREKAQADADRAMERARVGKDPQLVWPALAFSARGAFADRRQAGQ